MRKAVGLGLGLSRSRRSDWTDSYGGLGRGDQPGGVERSGSGDPDTTVTSTVTSGALAMAAPATADLGSGTPGGIISADLGTVNPGEINTTGTISATGTTITLSGTPQTVVAGTAGVGNNSDSWAPALVVSVPASNAGGVYTGTLTQSVS